MAILIKWWTLLIDGAVIQHVEIAVRNQTVPPIRPPSVAVQRGANGQEPRNEQWEDS